MDETHHSTSGIEVREQVLDPWELGFLAGVLAAWGVKAPSSGEFRDALKMLMAQRHEPRPTQPPHPGLRLAAAKPRQPPSSS
jgi:hypothetical protein